MIKLCNSEIDTLEQSLRTKLPGLYRKLLVEEGYGFSPSNAVEFLAPGQMAEMYSRLKLPEDLMFAPYFPIGYKSQTQEVWIIDAERELACTIALKDSDAPNLDHADWLSYEDWVMRYFEEEFPCEEE